MGKSIKSVSVKRIILNSFIFLLTLGTPVSLFSQQPDASTVASATIVNPVGFTKTIITDYNAYIFAGTVEMTSAKETHDKGEIVFPIATGSFTAVAISSAGATGYSFCVSQPAMPFTIGHGTSRMTVTKYAIDNTIDTGPGQTGGICISLTSSDVTVNYN